MDLSDEQIRKWVLSDEYLYSLAREFGGGGDDAMYAALPRFIEQRRDMLRGYIGSALREASRRRIQ